MRTINGRRVGEVEGDDKEPVRELFNVLLAGKESVVVVKVCQSGEEVCCGSPTIANDNPLFAFFDIMGLNDRARDLGSKFDYLLVDRLGHSGGLLEEATVADLVYVSFIPE